MQHVILMIYAVSSEPTLIYKINFKKNALPNHSSGDKGNHI